MGAYITGTSAISPQHTFADDHYLKEAVAPTAEYFQCIEPNYKAYVDPKLSRRMARIIKMGVTSAIKCLQEAGINEPEAIITGTGMGCLKDTEKFLASVIENEEEMLSPTSFIQSTHNTIGGQIALMLKCNRYNYTYVQRGHSFESALMDGMMMIDEGADNILVGGVDEITPTFFDILEKMGCVSNYSPEGNHKNPVLGEGASFFTLSPRQSANTYAEIAGLSTFYNPGNLDEAAAHLRNFLKQQGTDLAGIDAVMVGTNGHQPDDKWYDFLYSEYFKDKPLLGFKHLCGEYHTATSFALNLAANMLQKDQVLAPLIIRGNAEKPIKHLLIYNHYKQRNHSLILLKQCAPTG